MVNHLDGYDEFLQATMDEWKVPGMAVAIVKDGEVIHSRGYGLRDVEKGLKVTPETLFQIGSTTKAFTAAAMAILVDEGKLDWDKPVRHYLPDFKLWDSYVSENITPRDLLTHRSGVPRHDLAWLGWKDSRKELVHLMRYLEPSRDFRTSYQYNNLMYVAAGYLVGEIAGCSWEEFVKERLMAPLGMASREHSVTAIDNAADHALPYARHNDKVIRVPIEAANAVGPCGGIGSNVVDMAKWLCLNLNEGSVDGKQIISRESMSEIHSPQMAIRTRDMEPTMQLVCRYQPLGDVCYGFGWNIQPYWGRTTVYHTGATPGFITMASYIPRENIGVVVLSNLNQNFMPLIATFDAYDRLLGLNRYSWNDHIKKGMAEFEVMMQRGKERINANRKAGTNPSHALADYAGKYVHPGYGSLSVVVEGDHLKMDFHGDLFPLQHYHYDTFDHVITIDESNHLGGQRAVVSFLTDVNGNVHALSMPLEPATGEIVFKRQA